MKKRAGSLAVGMTIKVTPKLMPNSAEILDITKIPGSKGDAVLIKAVMKKGAFTGNGTFVLWADEKVEYTRKELLIWTAIKGLFRFLNFTS